MTDEIRQRANALYKSIEDTRAMENIIDNMMQCPDFMVSIECINIGVVKMKVDDIYSALNYIRDVLREKKEELEDEYRML